MNDQKYPLIYSVWEIFTHICVDMGEKVIQVSEELGEEGKKKGKSKR